jgi:hypothetical protein
VEVEKARWAGGLDESRGETEVERGDGGEEDKG